MPNTSSARRGLLLVDGNSLAYRAHYAMVYAGYTMRAADGTPTAAVHGMGTMIFNLLVDFKPAYVLVAFDHGKRVNRHDQFAEYKAGRKPMPDDLVVQMPLIRELMRHLGIATMSLEGIEADDIIGSLAVLFSKNGIPVKIVSSDNDMLQLIDENVSVVRPVSGTGKTKTIDLKNFQRAYMEVLPAQVPDLKGIMGDASDNIQGIKGVGPKGALKLLAQYKTIEGIYEHVEELPAALKKKVLDGKLSAILSKKLATIDTNIPLDIDEQALLLHGIDEQNLYPFLDRLQLSSLRRKFSTLEEVLDG